LFNGSASFSASLRSTRLTWPVASAVAALLAAYVIMALAASWQKGMSFDEGEQIAVGYNIWQRHDFRMEAANGDLVKRWATLPLLVSQPALPSTATPTWRAGAAYEMAHSFFFNQGNDARTILRQTRPMIALLGAATGLLVFFCSRELFGPLGGLISLTLFVSSSSMLAFGGMVSTEMAVCLTLLGAAWSIWRLLHHLTWGRLASSLIFIALLVLAKPSAMVIFPLTALLVAVKLIRGRPLAWSLGAPRLVPSRSAQAGIFAGLFVLHGLVGWTAVWAHYDFRYVASPQPTAPDITLPRQARDPVDPRVASFLTWSRRTHFLPEGFLHGIELLLSQNESQAAFMDGQWKFGGWRTFFPYAMWVKTHPSLWLVVVLVAVGSHRQWRSPPALSLLPASAPHPPPATLLYQATPFFALVAVYIGIAITWDLNIGFRHALPIYPAIYVLTGMLALLWSQHGQAIKTAVTALLLWHASGPVGIFPHYLAYFSPVAGGPTQGYRRLVDSSLDWGMDLPGLKRWLDQHNPADRSPFYLAYFGVEAPDYYRINSRRLPGQPDWRVVEPFPLTPGIYAISATLLQGIGTYTTGPWNKVFEQEYQRTLKNIEAYNRSLRDPAQHAALLKQHPLDFWAQEYSTYEKLRFGRLSAWLRRKRPPDDQIGYAILVWRLDLAEITAALLAPPVELAEAPLRR
jgi:hypothetical protein